MHSIHHDRPGVNGCDGRSVEDAMSHPFNPGVFCLRCWEDLRVSAYRVSFIGEPTVVSTPICEACYPGLKPDEYVYARKVEVRRG